MAFLFVNTSFVVGDFENGDQLRSATFHQATEGVFARSLQTADQGEVFSDAGGMKKATDTGTSERL